MASERTRWPARLSKKGKGKQKHADAVVFVDTDRAAFRVYWIDTGTCS